MSISPNELVEKHGYTIDDAKAVAEVFNRDKGNIAPLNKRCFEAAKRYLKSSLVLWEQCQTAENADLAPGLVLCKSIALELFFKTLVIIDRDELRSTDDLSDVERNKFRTHVIPKIYDQIDQKYQARIAEVYCEKVGVPLMNAAEFREQLVKKANDTFVKWRYIFETGTNEVAVFEGGLIDSIISATMITIVEVKNGVKN